VERIPALRSAAARSNGFITIPHYGAVSGVVKWGQLSDATQLEALMTLLQEYNPVAHAELAEYAMSAHRVEGRWLRGWDVNSMIGQY